MLDSTNIRLSDEEIREIELADKLYRNMDLESFAIRHEDELLNSKMTLISSLFISPNIDSFHDIIRVSINRTIRDDKSNNRLSNIEDLKYPPEKVLDKLYYNRASYKNQSIFYGGFGDFQALFENQPNTGDLFTISTWRQKKDTKLCFASIFHDEKLQDYSDIFHEYWNHYIDQLEKLDQRTADAIYKLFSLLTFFFTRPIHPNKRIEYILSAHLANKIFNLPYSPKIEAILYPSVPMQYIACNLAILPESFDKKFEFIKAEEFIVLRRPQGKNQWMSHKIAESNTFDNNTLHWETLFLPQEIKNFLRNMGVDMKLI